MDKVNPKVKAKFAASFIEKYTPEFQGNQWL
jgi:hypothetical protein